MSAVNPTLPKLVVQDSYDDEDLTDIDDEVFIQDGKSGNMKLRDDSGVKQPLMAPRRKYKKSHFETYKFPNKTFYIPLCFGLMSLVVLLSLLTLCVYIINIVPMPISLLRNWISRDLEDTINQSNVIPCTSLATKVLWSRSLPKFISESPLRTTDVDNDGIEDIIIGFSTGLDTAKTPEYICALYFEGQIPCFGGILALNGKTGDTLWIHWTTHAIFSIDCNSDLTNDEIKDCIICGHGGILHAVNGRDGSRIWKTPVRELSGSEKWKLSDIYDAKFIADIDGDAIGDIIASHTIESREIHLSEILIISGVNGNVIQNLILPTTEQLFLAPQKLMHPDGESIFVLVTSNRKQSGGLYIISQVDLMYGNLNLRKLNHNTEKGILLPPILVDVTLDGIEDITAIFNSTIIIYNGLTFEPVWNYTIPNSEVTSIPIPGYYNDDNVPDFMIKYQISSGFPANYYTIATIIDGKSGKPLLEEPIEGSLNKEMSGLSITVEGFGNDWFLHWSLDSLNYDGITEKYKFLKSENLVSESHGGICKPRFNSTLITTLYALNQHVGPPGITLYVSIDPKSLEYNISKNSKIESDINILSVSERSSKVNQNENKENVSTQKYEGKSDNTNNNREVYKQHTTNQKVYNQNSKVGNFNNDYNLKNGNEWIKANIQASKDYDIMYDNNIQNQPADYLLLDKIREERSNINNVFNHKYNINVKNFVKHIINNQSYITNKRNVFDEYFTNFDTTKNKDAGNTVLITEIVNFLQKYINKTQKSNEQTIVNAIGKHAYNFANILNKREVSIKNKILKQNLLKYQNKKLNIEGKQRAKLTNKFQIGFKKQEKKRNIISKHNIMYPIHSVQKQSPTGVLLPSISNSKKSTSIDLVFSTFWLPSSDMPIILVQEDLNCIRRKQKFSGKEWYEENGIVKECLNERDVKYRTFQEATDPEKFKISLGQMTIYRMRLECTCPEDMLPNQSCKNISSDQSWSEYLGSHGNGYFKPLSKPNV